MTNYTQGLIVQSVIVVIAVAGMFPMTGLAGMVSFGQAAFMAVSSYTMAMLTAYLEIPLIIACIIGILFSSILSLIIAIPTLKLRKDYFSLITIGLNEAIIALILTFSEYTYGGIGFSRIPKVKNIMYISLVIMIVTILLMYNFKHSRFGRMCIALKNDELAAKSFGIKVYSLKIKTYIIASIFSGIAGIIYAFQTRLIDPYSFGWSKSSEMAIFMFFGGTNSLIGSSISAFVLKLVPEFLRNITVFGKSLQEYRIIIYCIAVVVIINFRPAGLFGEWEPTAEGFKKLFTKAKGLFKKRGGENYE